MYETELTSRRHPSEIVLNCHFDFVVSWVRFLNPRDQVLWPPSQVVALRLAPRSVNCKFRQRNVRSRWEKIACSWAVGQAVDA